MILLAILFPPIAVLLKGKPIQALLNIVLCCLCWIPGIIHAVMVVNSANADKRTDRIVEAIKDNQDSEE